MKKKTTFFDRLDSLKEGGSPKKSSGVFRTIHDAFQQRGSSETSLVIPTAKKFLKKNTAIAVQLDDEMTNRGSNKTVIPKDFDLASTFGKSVASQHV